MTLSKAEASKCMQKKNLTINTCALPETEVKFNFRQRQKTTEMTVKVKYSQIFKSLTSDLFYFYFLGVFFAQ